MEIASTERLLLRELHTGDAPFVLELLNTPGWQNNIGDRGVKTLSAAELYIRDHMISGYHSHGFGLYLMVLKDEQLPVGICGLVSREELDASDLGFALLPAYEGKGYAFEAAARVLDYARDELRLPRVLAITLSENEGSLRLLKKLGMHFEKVITIKGTKLMQFAKDL